MGRPWSLDRAVQRQEVLGVPVLPTSVSQHCSPSVPWLLVMGSE